jgi:hypothetical protein
MTCATPTCGRRIPPRRKYCSHQCANANIALQRVNAWHDARQGEAEAKERIAAVVKLAQKQIPVRKAAPPKHPKGDLMCKIDMADLHMGKLAWGRETGWGNYDLKIAEKRHDEALASLLARTADLPIAQYVLVVGGDLLHADTIQGTTTKGTPMDTDGRAHKAFERALWMEIRTIETLRQRGPVHVIGNPGNHDRASLFHLVMALEMFFHKTLGVTFDNAPTPQHYYQWGDVMLMIAHGDLGKIQEYPQIMALERPQMWAATKFREAHTQHRHQEAGLVQLVQEFKGVKVRTMPALCGVDAFHANEHYIGKLEGAQAFVYSKTQGLVLTVYYNIPLAPEAQAA